MKIQLDTVAKVIRVEETINLGEFLKAIKDLLPNDLWKEYKLETNTIINWSYPYYIYEKRYHYPWLEPTITYTTGTNMLIDTRKENSVYCIEY